MRQAITAKYLSPTNTKGARIKVACAARTKIFGYDYSLDTAENCQRAAEKLALELNWLNKNQWLAGGATKSGEYVFVLVQS